MEPYSVEENSQPAAPPTNPVAIMPVKPGSSWPMVLGVFAIILGVLGIVQGLWTCVSPLFIDIMQGFMEEVDQAESTFAAMQKWAWWFFVSGAIVTMVAVWLLIGGVKLTQRKPSARKTMISWSVVKIVWALIMSVLGIFMQLDQMKDAEAQMAAQGGAGGGPTAAMTGQIMQISLIVGTLFNIVWMCALPVFCLIWLNRPKVKVEVSEWA